jgi:hypothetical protein
VLRRDTAIDSSLKRIAKTATVPSFYAVAKKLGNPICVAPHNDVRFCKGSTMVKFETATTLLLAFVAQALAIGVVLAI